jgi:hypothetical protein
MKRNPNPSADPVYANPSRNIFIRLQQRRIKNYTNAPMKCIQFSKSLPPPDDMDLHSIDSKYLTYFVTEIPKLLGPDGYWTSAIKSIFQQSVNHPVLRFSILALSSWIMDNRQGRPPLYTLRHLQRILPGIQEAIINLNITTGHILSVSFLAWLSLMTGDLHTTHRHLKGLFLMFLETRHLSLHGVPHDNPDPVIMFLYRMSFKIDITLAYRNFPLAYPPMTNHESQHRQWLPMFLSKRSDIENCVAQFELDDFTNQICHLHYQTRELRKQSELHEPEIRHRAKAIANDLAEWLLLPIVNSHIPVDNSFPGISSSVQEQIRFLHYPEYPISNVTFAQMFLIHASLGIHLSIIETGKLGPYPQTRYDYAIQVCRIYASLGSLSSAQKTGQSRVINALWLAGLVLGNDCYPAGTILINISNVAYQWIIQALLDLDRNRGYRAPSKLVDALNETWARNGEVDAWEIVGQVLDVSWKMVRNNYEPDAHVDLECKDTVDLETYS